MPHYVPLLHQPATALLPPKNSTVRLIVTMKRHTTTEDRQRAEQLETAIDLVKNHGYSYRRAAKAAGLSHHSTLTRRLHAMGDDGQHTRLNNGIEVEGSGSGRLAVAGDVKLRRKHVKEKHRQFPPHITQSEQLEHWPAVESTNAMNDNSAEPVTPVGIYRGEFSSMVGILVFSIAALHRLLPFLWGL